MLLRVLLRVLLFVLVVVVLLARLGVLVLQEVLPADDEDASRI